jgi:hypothetical protein
MAYYTEEDRRKATATRKRNQQFRQLMRAPEDALDIWGVKVPKVSIRPRLDEYGISEHTEEQLKQLDKDSLSKKKSERATLIISVQAVVFLICWWIGSKIPNQNPGSHISSFWIGVGLFSVIGIWVGAGLGEIIGKATPEKSPLHDQWEEYNNQLRYYEYWQRKKDKNHWNRMSGHAFEQAVANLFRNIGFTAEASKRGGDGGVDIILEKANRKIAVQCKRYKKSVGPHVVRDLWGTMNYLGYDEGCIVTTTGFTSGVQSFASDKNIYLIDLNDILRGVNDDTNTYLSRKIRA